MQQKWNSLDEGRHLTLNLLSKEIELRNGEVKKLNLPASCLNVFVVCCCCAYIYVFTQCIVVCLFLTCLLLKLNSSNKIVVPDFLSKFLDQTLGFPLKFKREALVSTDIKSLLFLHYRVIIQKMQLILSLTGILNQSFRHLTLMNLMGRANKLK